jgi:hypothetical protein
MLLNLQQDRPMRADAGRGDEITPMWWQRWLYAQSEIRVETWARQGEAKFSLRAMSDGSLDSQVGARICNGLGIMRMCFETQKLQELEVRMGEINRRIVDARPAIPAPLSIDHETYGSQH